MKYLVVVTREDGTWLATAPDVPGAHTEARSLRMLDRNIREVIALVEDLPEGAETDLDLRYEFHTGDAYLDSLVAQARDARESARQAHERAASLTAEALRRARGGDRPAVSERDAAMLLGLSHQRVHQLC